MKTSKTVPARPPAKAFVASQKDGSYAVYQGARLYGSGYDTREEAQDVADRLNAEAGLLPA